MTTINEVESAFSALLGALQGVTFSPELNSVREFLLPKGFVPVVQLEEGGRKKRSSAAAGNWTPETGEIRIYFDPIPPVQPKTTASTSTAALYQPANVGSTSNVPSLTSMQPTSIQGASGDAVTPQEMIECCQALAAAEKSNRQFIALKWFRDDFLATVDFSWAKSPLRRQRVLSQAIEIGRIDAKKIPNPKSSFPTTTISLNRAIPTPGVTPRFQPIPVRGEPVSATLLRDRGNY